MKQKILRVAAAALAALLTIPEFVSYAEEVMPMLDFTGPHVSEEQLQQINEAYHSRTLCTTEDGLFTYRIDRDPHLCSLILEYHGEGGDIVIPDCAGCVRINMTVIDFSGREDITSVTHAGFPVFAYFNDKFQNCVNLKSFTVCAGATDELLKCYYPDGLPEALGNGKKFRQRYTLAANKFEGCTSLKEVNLPYLYGDPHSEYACAYIGTECFKGCTALQEITLGGDIIIAEDAFVNCTALEKVVFDGNVKKIEDHALGYLKNEDGTYQRCDGLTIYGVAGTAAETYAAENGIPFVAAAPTCDINQDGEFGAADVVLLAKFLLTADDMQYISLECADLNTDGKINAVDLTLMKQELLMHHAAVR